ncbi:MAG: Modulator of FtsH protease HflK [Verrucomicrobia subdivision 3 bacterium]|nr:Modulator of FtsH protease HflK [Limisphaerales bacterium]MCS1412858.1 Modulator of FtsH protease HflK [Limisphaerales bacterium]
MERNIQQNGFINLVILLVAGATAVVIADYAGSVTALVGAVYLGLGFLVAAVSYFQMRLENREELERLEYDEMMRERKNAALFADTGDDTFIAKRAREQFERFFVPGFTVVFFLAQVMSVYFLWQWLPKAEAPDLGNAAIAMVAFATFSLILFLLGKYSSGIARMEGQRLLRPGGAYLLLGSVICMLVVLTEAGAWFGFEQIGLLVGRILVVFLGLVAAESFVNLVLEIYRPRSKGKEYRPLYESRLVGLLGQPAGLVTTATQALDYQFGFKISETWFYRFLEKALAWLILLQLSILMLSTTFVILEPHELGLVERFGRLVASREVLEPGLHFKLPWPIEQVYRYPANEIQSFHVGYTIDDERHEERTLLWTVSHYQEEVNFLVASKEQEGSAGDQTVPVNLLTAAIPVQYRITNLRDWIYNHGNPKELMEEIGNREVVRYLVSVDVLDIMSKGRLEAAISLTERIQAAADKAKLGVEVLFVGLQDIHPPVGDKRVAVAGSFEEVIGAVQEKEATILAAEGYAAEVVPVAKATAAKRLSEAAAYRKERVARAKAAAAQFKHQIATMNASPFVFQNRKYFEIMGNSLTNVRKYVIVPEHVEETFIINLEDNVAYDLLNARPESQ